MRLASFGIAIALTSMLGTGVVVPQQNSPPPKTMVAASTFNGDIITEEECEVLSSMNGAKPDFREAPNLSVLAGTQEKFLKLAEGEVLKGIVCWRSEARLAPGDYLVPKKLDVSLVIKTDTGDATKDRTLILEKAGGSPRVRLLAGPAWTKDEETEIEKAIQAYLKSGS